MSKSKKALDKDMMFQKIMPAIADNPFSVNSEVQAENEPVPVSVDDNLSVLRAKLFARPDSPIPGIDHVATINVMESLVLKRIDDVVTRFNCCHCDRCRRDIAALALNFLPPKYIVADPDHIEDLEREVPDKLVYDALVKAVLKVRSKPKH